MLALTNHKPTVTVRLLVGLCLLGLGMAALLSLSANTARSQPFKVPAMPLVCPQGPPRCDFASIQEAVQAAEPGSILRLLEGDYHENVTIEKSLTLVGSEPERVRLLGKDPNKPVLLVRPEGNFQLILNGLTIISEGSKYAVLVVPKGDGAESSLLLSLSDVQVVDPRTGVGLRLCQEDERFHRLRVSLSRVRFESGFAGVDWRCSHDQGALQVRRSSFVGSQIGLLFSIGSPSQVEISESTFEGNLTGLIAGVSGYLVIKDSAFRGNSIGLELAAGPESTLYVVQSTFEGNTIGAFVKSLGIIYGPTEGAKVRIADSEFRDNELYGVKLFNAYDTTLEGNVIRHNGTGILIGFSNNRLWISDNVVQANREWGVALQRPPCIGEDKPFFKDALFRVWGEDNVIRDNGRGDLCPEEFNWPPNFVSRPDETEGK